MAEWQTAGKVRMVHKGVHDNTLTYEVLDCVTDEDKTVYYVAKKAVPVGISLDNTEYWGVILDVHDLTSDVDELKFVTGITIEPTKNLWHDGDFSITDETTGFIQFLLKEPLPAGTYTLSGIASTTNTATESCRFRFSNSQNAASLPSSSFIADVYLLHTGVKESATFTISETAYSVRVMSASTTSNSSGHGGSFTNIQIESGTQATDYILPYSSTDVDARQDIKDIDSVQDMMIDTESSLFVSNNCETDNPTNGLTFKCVQNKLRITGTATSSRRYVVFNGRNLTKSTSSDFASIVDAGTYRVTIKSTGKVTVNSLVASYSTFANEFRIYDNEIVTLTAPTMIGLLAIANTDFGSVSNNEYTDVEVAFNRIEANSYENEYGKHAIKKSGQLSRDGYPHQGFPDVDFWNGKLCVVSHVSSSHYTPYDSNEWGGIEIDTITLGGEKSYIKLLTKDDFPAQNGDSGLEGEVRELYVYPTKYGLLGVGWTTYYTVMSEIYTAHHDSFIVLFDNDYNVISYKVNPVTATIDGNTVNVSFTGKPMLTPDGHIIATCYRNGIIWVCRSTTAFSGDVDINYSLTTVQSEDDSPENNECSLGYCGDKLYLLARNNTSRDASCLYCTENLEGNSGWAVIKSYSRATDGVNAVIHSPRLLPHSTTNNTGCLFFAGSNFRGSYKRNSVIGFIDLEDGDYTLRIGDIDTLLNYGGYTGIVPCGNDEYYVVYYREGSSTTDASTAIETGLYFKKISARAFFPYIY